MEYIKNNLSDRFFYVRERTPADDGITAAAYDRMFPMSRLQAMCMVSADSLEVSFDDAGVGDHTTVKLLITSGKGREAIKDIVDAINSTQKIVTLGNELTKESVINDFISVNQIAEGAVGTFALNGALTVAGDATVTSAIIASGSIVLGSETQSVDAAAVSKAKPVTFLAHDADEAVTLADGTEEGRLIRIVSKTNDTVTLTPATTAGAYATIAFTNIGESVTLMWTAVGWAVLSRCGGGAAAADAVATMPVLAT